MIPLPDTPWVAIPLTGTAEGDWLVRGGVRCDVVIATVPKQRDAETIARVIAKVPEWVALVVRQATMLQAAKTPWLEELGDPNELHPRP